MSKSPFKSGLWFSGRGLFRHAFRNKAQIPQYEERVVVIKAKSAAAAEREIIKEFKVYGNGNTGVTFLGEYEIQDILAVDAKVTEVAYLMRVSDLTPAKYIKALWEDGRPSNCKSVGWNHVWHNLDNKSVYCYNCRKVAKGSKSLWDSWGLPGPYGNTNKNIKGDRGRS